MKQTRYATLADAKNDGWVTYPGYRKALLDSGRVGRCSYEIRIDERRGRSFGYALSLDARVISDGYLFVDTRCHRLPYARLWLTEEPNKLGHRGASVTAVQKGDLERVLQQAREWCDSRVREYVQTIDRI